MNHLFRSIVAIVMTSAMLSACGGKESSGDVFLQSVTGGNGEILVVMNDYVKNDTSGQYIMDMLTDDYLGLSVSEPIFDVQVVPHPYFNDQMKKFRNIMYVVVSDSIQKDTVQCFDNVWAQPQAYISVRARSRQSLLPLVERNHIKIVSYLSRSERNRMIAFNKRIPNLNLNEEIAKRYGININVPNMFSRCKPEHDGDMMWTYINTDESQVGLFIYDFPYVGEGTLSTAYILNKRDSLLRENIGGPQGSFMCTEVRFGLDEILYKSGKFKGMDVAELRGQWRMEGYAMGGPFMLRAHHDTINNRVVVTDGYVYYPSKSKKRNLLRQLESVMYTLDVAKKDNEK